MQLAAMQLDELIQGSMLEFTRENLLVSLPVSLTVRQKLEIYF